MSSDAVAADRSTGDDHRNGTMCQNLDEESAGVRKIEIF